MYLVLKAGQEPRFTDDFEDTGWGSADVRVYDWAMLQQHLADESGMAGTPAS